jgi:hypothetical protein
MVEEELKCIAFPDIRNTSCCITVKFSYQKKKRKKKQKFLVQKVYVSHINLVKQMCLQTNVHLKP